MDHIAPSQSITIKLTRRERDCLQGLADGLSAKEIATALGISPRTVEHHIARAQTKMQARTGAQAVARAVALRLIAPVPILNTQDGES